MSAAKTRPAARTGTKALVDRALQITWRLKGDLKRAQLAYLRIGALLAQVREENLYGALKHPDLADYAEKRLRLGRASLYRYLQVYDWVRESHPEWLQPKAKGFIPDLSDTADLIWIENRLKESGLDAKTKTELGELRRKGLEGSLRQDDIRRWRRGKGKALPDADLKAFLARLDRLRQDASDISGMPAEALSHLAAAADILGNAVTLHLAGLSGWDGKESGRYA